MAVRFDAVSEDYSRALSLGSQTALTACCWLKVSVDRNTWSSAFFIDNGQADNWGVQTAEDGVTVGTVLDGNSTTGFAATVGTWYFICFASSGTTGTLYRKAAGDTSLSTTAITGVTATNAATLRLGRSPWDGEWLNGSLAAVKVWNVQLTQAEIELEAAQYIPNKVASLVSFHPLVRAETTDYSGNARTLSGGTGTTTEDGPPIPWWVNSPRLILPAPAAGTTFNLDQASETDSASTATASKTSSLGLTTETDSALGVASTKAVTLGLATETASSTAVAASKALTLGIPAETDTALALSASKTVTLGIATETDTALALVSSGSATHELGLATEADAVAAAAATKLVTLGIATESDVATAFAGIVKTLSLGLAAETDDALSLTQVAAYTAPDSVTVTPRGYDSTTTPRPYVSTATPRSAE